MIIRGLQPFSMLDFPGKFSCIVFVGNCNFRCPYCHNPSLVFDPESQPEVTREYFFDFLSRRQGRLDGVVISGGEPTLHPGLPGFVDMVKNMEYLVKLDTNGTNPEMVRRIHETNRIDYIAIDYKAPAARYSLVTRNDGHAALVQQTIRYAAEQGISMEIRTTVHRDLLGEQDFAVMRRELDALGASRWYLQQFNTTSPELVDDSLLGRPTYSDLELLHIAEATGGDTQARGLTGSLIKHRGVVKVSD